MKHETIVLEMVVIDQATVLEAFTSGEALDDAIGQVRDVVENFEHDMTTKTGRARTRSFAAKIPKVKTALAAMGRGLTAEWKAKAKLVDKSIGTMSTSIDELRDIARKPLTDWEAQEAKEEEERAALKAAEELAAKIESDHDYALLMNEKIEREAIEAKAEAERQEKADAEFDERLRVERENRIAAEASERAARKAEEKAAAEKIAAANRIDEMEEAACRNLIKVKEAEERVAHDRAKAAKDAEAREATRIAEAKAASERAEREKVEAIKAAEIKAEREAQAKEDARLAEEQRLLAEQKKREANQTHRRKFNNEILADLMAAGLDEATGKNLIKLLATGKISHTTISY